MRGKPDKWLKVGKKRVGRICYGCWGEFVDEEETKMVYKDEFHADRTRKKHFFILYQGWGISKSIIEILEKEGVERICLTIKDECRKSKGTITAKEFRTTISIIKEKGIEVAYVDEQYILPEKYWENSSWEYPEPEPDLELTKKKIENKKLENKNQTTLF